MVYAFPHPTGNSYEVQAEPSVWGRVKSGLGILVSTALRVKIIQVPLYGQIAMALILKLKEIV